MKAAALAIPEEVLEQHVITFGKTGAGKSSTLRHLVENRISLKKRVCIIDPKGDWWGLPSSADGKGPGFPVVLFGDFRNDRSDVPMDARAGKELAQIIASSDQAMVLGFRGWMPADLTRFWLDFAPALFNLNRGELYLVIDEVHNFAPKAKILSPDSGKMLHWTNRLAAEGRGIGLKILMASQRPQKVHNDTASCCETMIAMRVTHPRDRAALKEWMDECGEPAKGKDVLAEVSSMRRGQAWVWFPAGDYLEKVQFPMFKSFDSFSERATDPPKTWAKVDVEAVRQKLARVVQEKEASDPKKLQARVSELMLRVNSIAVSVGMEIPKEWTSPLLNLLASTVHQRVQPQQPAEPEKVPALSADEFEQLCDIRRELEKVNLLAPLIERIAARKELADKAKITRTVSSPSNAPWKPISKAALNIAKEPPHIPRPQHNGGLGAMQRAFLTALAQHEGGGLTKAQILTLTDYRSSGPVSKCFAHLHRLGWTVADSGTRRVHITREGLKVLGDFERLPTGHDLRQLLLIGSKTNQMEKAFLKELFAAYPNSISKGELLRRTGYASSGPVSKCFAKLVRIEYAKAEGPGLLKASPTFFEI